MGSYNNLVENLSGITYQNHDKYLQTFRRRLSPSSGLYSEPQIWRQKIVIVIVVNMKNQTLTKNIFLSNLPLSLATIRILSHVPLHLSLAKKLTHFRGSDNISRDEGNPYFTVGLYTMNHIQFIKQEFMLHLYITRLLSSTNFHTFFFFSFSNTRKKYPPPILWTDSVLVTNKRKVPFQLNSKKNFLDRICL